MSFKEIILPAFIIGDLYCNVLIENIDDNVIVTTNSMATKAQVKFLGDNQKNIVFVVNENDAVFVNDEKLQIITKMLDALHLSLADVAIVNTHNSESNYNTIQQQLEPLMLILLGINVKQFELPIIFPEYRVQQYTSTKILIAKALQFYLGTTENDRKEKLSLWNSMKLMFGK